MEEIWFKVLGIGSIWTVAIAIIAYLIYRIFE
jgi:hypothetical protein